MPAGLQHQPLHELAHERVRLGEHLVAPAYQVFLRLAAQFHQALHVERGHRSSAVLRLGRKRGRLAFDHDLS